MSNHEVPAEIERNLKKWHLQVNALRATRVTLGIVGIASSVVVASAAGGLSPEKIRVLALAAAISAGVVGFTDLSGKANRMRSAWRLLSAERLRYLHPDDHVSTLIDTYEKAEGMIGDVNFTSDDDDRNGGQGGEQQAGA